MKITQILFFSLVLAGCATQAKYKEVLDSWVGSSESDVVATWGVPARTHEAQGLRVLEYYDSKESYSAAYNKFTKTTEVSKDSWDCLTRFIFRGGKLESYTFQGPACRSK